MKKQLILIIFLQIFILSCNQKKDLEKIWISNNWTQSKDAKEYKKIKEKIAKDKKSYKEGYESFLDSLYNVTVDDKLIYQFSKDSVIITHFNSSRYDGFTRSVFDYNYLKDSIEFIKDDRKVTSFKVKKLTPQKLILSYRYEESFLPENVLTFQPMEQFSVKEDIEDVKSFIGNEKFKIGGIDTEIVFSTPSSFSGKINVINPNKSFNVNSGNNWHLIDISSGLFLVVGGELIQIVELQEDKIIGYRYKDRRSEISLVKE